MAEQKVDSATGPSAEERISDRAAALKEINERRAAEVEAEAKESIPAGTGSEPVALVPPTEVETTDAEDAAALKAAGEQATAAAETAGEPATSSSSSAPSPSPSTAALPFDQNAEYEIMVEGQPVKVKGEKIIDIGKRTLQKEVAADYKLRMASELLQEAQRRAQALPQGGPTAPAPSPAPTPAILDEVKLAEAIQFGTREQAAEAIKKLRDGGRPVQTPEQILQFVAPRIGRLVTSQIEFQKAVDMVQKDYADLLGDDYLRRMFFSEENRRRAPRETGGESNTQPHMALYKSIGDDLRKRFGKPVAPVTASVSTAPAQSLEEKAAAKAAAPVVPQPASARIEGKGPTKAPSHTEIIEQIRRSRHQITERR